MEFCTFASGSSGNCTLVRTEQTSLLVDAGISCRRIRQALASFGLTVESLDGILITHEHSDHISGLATLLKYFRIPVFASRGTVWYLSRTLRSDVFTAFDAGSAFQLGDISVQSFSTSHDASDSVGYRLSDRSSSLGILTDTGFVPADAERLLPGVSALLLEANHDPDMLRFGSYPYPLKQRIFGQHGHLSNEAAAAFALMCARQGTADILLAHLSKENNTPQLAEAAVGQLLLHSGCSVRLGIAPRDTSSEVHLCKRSPSFVSES